MRKLFLISVLVGFLLIPSVYAFEPITMIGVAIAFAVAAAAGFGGKKAYDDYRSTHYDNDYYDKDYYHDDWDKDKDTDPARKADALKRRRESLRNLSHHVSEDESLTTEDTTILEKTSLYLANEERRDEILSEASSHITFVSYEKAKLAQSLALQLIVLQEALKKNQKIVLHLIASLERTVLELKLINTDLMKKLKSLHFDMQSDEMRRELGEVIRLGLNSEQIIESKERILAEIKKLLKEEGHLQELYDKWKRADIDLEAAVKKQVGGEKSEEKALEIAAEHVKEIKMLDSLLAREETLLGELFHLVQQCRSIEAVDERLERIREIINEVRALVSREIADNSALKKSIKEFELEIKRAFTETKETLHYLVDEEAMDTEELTELRRALRSGVRAL